MNPFTRWLIGYEKVEKITFFTEREEKRERNFFKKMSNKEFSFLVRYNFIMFLRCEEEETYCARREKTKT